MLLLLEDTKLTFLSVANLFLLYRYRLLFEEWYGWRDKSGMTPRFCQP
jgi:hypothetical protein